MNIQKHMTKKNLIIVSIIATILIAAIVVSVVLLNKNRDDDPDFDFGMISTSYEDIELLKDISANQTFYINSNSNITNYNLNKFVRVIDLHENVILVTVSKEDGNYKISAPSSGYVAGMTYKMQLGREARFVDERFSGKEEIQFRIFKEETEIAIVSNSLEYKLKNDILEEHEDYLIVKNGDYSLGSVVAFGNGSCLDSDTDTYKIIGIESKGANLKLTFDYPELSDVYSVLDIYKTVDIDLSMIDLPEDTAQNLSMAFQETQYYHALYAGVMNIENNITAVKWEDKLLDVNITPSGLGIKATIKKGFVFSDKESGASAEISVSIDYTLKMFAEGRASLYPLNFGAEAGFYQSVDVTITIGAKDAWDKSKESVDTFLNEIHSLFESGFAKFYEETEEASFKKEIELLKNPASIKDIPVIGLITFNMEFNIVLRLDISAKAFVSFKVENKIGAGVDMGVRWFLTPYFNAYPIMKTDAQLNLMVEGGIEIRMGVRATGFFSLWGFSSMLRCGIEMERGVYLELGGVAIISKSFNNKEKFDSVYDGWDMGSTCFIEAGDYSTTSFIARVFFRDYKTQLSDTKNPSICRHGDKKVVFELIGNDDITLPASRIRLCDFDIYDARYYDYDTRKTLYGPIEWDKFIVIPSDNSNLYLDKDCLVIKPGAPLEFEEVITVIHKNGVSSKQVTVRKLMDVPALENAVLSYDKNSVNDVLFSVETNGSTFNKVIGNGIKASDYIFNNGALTIKKEYLNTLTYGEHAFVYASDRRNLNMYIVIEDSRLPMVDVNEKIFDYNNPCDAVFETYLYDAVFLRIESDFRISTADYFVNDGLITFYQSFLEELSLGEKTLTLVTNKNKIEIKIKVEDNRPPETLQVPYYFDGESDVNILFYANNLIINYISGNDIVKEDYSYNSFNSSLIVKASFLNSFNKGLHSFIANTNKGDVEFSIFILNDGVPYIPLTNLLYSAYENENIEMETVFRSHKFTGISGNGITVEDYTYIQAANIIRISYEFLDALGGGRYDFIVYVGSYELIFSITNKDGRKPTIDVTEYFYDKANPDDIEIHVNLLENTILNIAGNILNEDFVIDGETIILKNEFLYKQDYGTLTFSINTSKNSLTFSVTILDSRPPELVDDFIFYETFVHGDIIVPIELYCNSFIGITGGNINPDYYTYYTATKELVIFIAFLQQLSSGEYVFTIQTSCGDLDYTIRVVFPTEELTFTMKYDINYEGTKAVYDYYYSVKGSSDMSGEIVIPSYHQGLPVREIEASAFYNSNMTNVYIPNTITFIGAEAFRNCKYLEEVVIPDSVTSINSSYNYGADIYFGAFQGCTNLVSVQLSKNLEIIRPNTFYDCINLKSINMPLNLIEVVSTAFTNTALVNDAPNGIVYIDNWAVYFKGAETNVVIKDGTKGLANVLFVDHDQVRSLVIPNSVEFIGFRLFSQYSLINSLTVPFIGSDRAGSRFTLLREFFTVNLADSIMSSNFETLIVTEPITTLVDGVFNGCLNLANITIPDSVVSIGENAFGQTATWLFGGATQWYKNQPDGAVYFNSVLIGFKGTMPNNTNIVVREGTISIADYAFSSSSWLVSIVLPESLQYIGNYAFTYCRSLISVTFPESLLYIGKSAFSYCQSLHKIEIPASLVEIGERAFENCTGLASITFKGTIPPKIGKDFLGYDVSISSYEDSMYICRALIFVPEQALSLYKSTTNLSLSLISSRIYVVDTIDGDFYIINGVLIKYLGFGGDVTIPTNVTIIDKFAFQNNQFITKIIIPDNVTTIRNSAFNNCLSLTEVYITQSVTSFGAYAFNGCTNLATIHVKGLLLQPSEWNANWRTGCNVFVEFNCYH